jgi:hypothetical protein
MRSEAKVRTFHDTKWFNGFPPGLLWVVRGARYGWTATINSPNADNERHVGPGKGWMVSFEENTEATPTGSEFQKTRSHSHEARMEGKVAIERIASNI